MAKKIKINIWDKKNISIAIIVLLFLISLIFYYSVKGRNTIYSGVKIDGFKVSNLSKEEAAKFIKEQTELRDKDAKINFKYNDETYFVNLKDLGYSLNIDLAVEDAYKLGRDNSGVKNYFQIIKSSIFSKNIEIEENFNDKSIDETVNFLASKVFKEPRDAEVLYNSSEGFKLIKEEDGRYLDAKKVREMIVENLSSKGDIELPIIISKPRIYSKEFDGIDTLLAEYKTNYTKSPKNRKENIILGSRFFNNLVIKPKEVVSFNNVVGDISLANGFKEAGVIVNGEFDTGVGGGICQVSTTLYNALIRADLNIVERYNHTRPISYVPLGTDAAVAQGYKDLVFENNLKNNIYLKVFANEDDILFQVFGNKEDKNYDIEIIPKQIGVTEPNLIKKYSNNLEEGKTEVKKKGAKGYSYSTYKQLIKNGEIVDTIKISNSNYIPQDRVILIGEGDPDLIKAKKEAKEKLSLKKEKEKNNSSNKKS